jgi:hypothetical protein
MFSLPALRRRFAAAQTSLAGGTPFGMTSTEKPPASDQPRQQYVPQGQQPDLSNANRHDRPRRDLSHLADNQLPPADHMVSPQVRTALADYCSQAFPPRSLGRHQLITSVPGLGQGSDRSSAEAPATTDGQTANEGAQHMSTSTTPDTRLRTDWRKLTFCVFFGLVCGLIGFDLGHFIMPSGSDTSGQQDQTIVREDGIKGGPLYDRDGNRLPYMDVANCVTSFPNKDAVCDHPLGTYVHPNG